MSFFVISVLTFNLILWIVLLIRFKKLFSTDDIVKKTQDKIENLIRDIDTAADRDTYLAKETSKHIRSLLDDADKKMELFKEATQRLRDMIAETDRVSRKYEEGKAFELNIQNSRAIAQEAEIIPQNIDQGNTEENSYKEKPLIITKVYENQPVKSSGSDLKKDKELLVRKYLDQGKSIEEIAEKLDCSITEVQFIIDLL